MNLWCPPLDATSFCSTKRDLYELAYTLMLKHNLQFVALLCRRMDCAGNNFDFYIRNSNLEQAFDSR